MVLEAVMICLDNSEYMRNGDYEPDRLVAQNDTVKDISAHKTQSNQESTVGFLSMAGRRIETHMTPSRNVGAIMTALQKEVKAGGKANFIGGLKTAQLALKNRQNKNQRQRVMMFVGSPVLDDVAELVKLAKNFKKNNIAVDIINFGSENMTNENPEKLEAFIQAVNSSDNSHLVTIPPGPHEFSDLVMTSPIVMESAGGSATTSTITSNAASRGAAGGVADVDPNLDPELAMVIRMSAEDYKQKQQKKETGSSSSSASSTTSSSSSSSSSSASSSASSSTSSNPAPKPSTTATTTTTPAPSVPSSNDEQMADDELAQAIAMSMGAEEDSSESTPLLPSSSSSSSSASSSSTTTKPKKSDESKDVTDALRDPEFLSSLLESVPGVDIGQGEIDDILNKLTGDDESSSNDKTKDKSKDNKDKDNKK